MFEISIPFEIHSFFEAYTALRTDDFKKDHIPEPPVLLTYKFGIKLGFENVNQIIAYKTQIDAILHDENLIINKSRRLEKIQKALVTYIRNLSD